MKCPLYRSLDRPSAFFGIRGRFKTWFGIGLSGGLFLALFVGTSSQGFYGFLALFVYAGIEYGIIMALQDRFSDRQLTLRMNSRRYVKFIKYPPFAIRHLWRRDRTDDLFR